MLNKKRFKINLYVLNTKGDVALTNIPALPFISLGYVLREASHIDFVHKKREFYVSLENPLCSEKIVKVLKVNREYTFYHYPLKDLR